MARQVASEMLIETGNNWHMFMPFANDVNDLAHTEILHVSSLLS